MDEKEVVVLNQMLRLIELASKYPELKDWITETSKNIAEAKKEGNKMFEYIREHMDPSDSGSVIKFITENSIKEEDRITVDIDNTLSDGVKVLNTLYTYDNNPTIPGFSTEISCTIEERKVCSCIGSIAYAIDRINKGEHSKYYKAEFRCFPKRTFNSEVNRFVVLLSTPGHEYYNKELYFNPKTKRIELNNVVESWR